MIELNIEQCTRDAETCPVVVSLMEQDAFDFVVTEIDPDAAARRELVGNLFTACVNGNCFGHDPRLALYLWRKKLDERDQR